jgi:hypothetical protein
MHYRQTLRDDQRLELIKLGFPRPDLIKWFDQAAPHGLPPERYMLLLLMSVATALGPRNGTGLQYGIESDLDLFRSLSAAQQHNQGQEIVIDPSDGSRVSEEFLAFVSDQTSLIQGVSNGSAGHGCEVVLSALTVRAPNARRICIVSDSVFAEYLHMDGTWGGHLVYQGVLQYWPERTSSVIFRSYLEPSE